MVAGRALRLTVSLALALVLGVPGLAFAQAAVPPGTPASAADAAPPPGLQWQLELGQGHLSLSSPVVRLTPEGTLVRVPGVQRLSGNFQRLGAQAHGELVSAAPCSLTLGGAASAQVSRQPSIFEMAQGSVQPAVHCATAWGSVGAAAQAQRIDVARERFRSVRSQQFDWTLANEQGHWTLLLDLARWRHTDDLTELDARARTLLVQRRMNLEGALKSLDLALFASRERNQRASPENSQRSLTLQATLAGRGAAAEDASPTSGWSVGGLLQRARFDQAGFLAPTARRDRAFGLDFAWWRTLGADTTLRFELSAQRARSTVALYEQNMLQAALLLQWGSD